MGSGRDHEGQRRRARWAAALCALLLCVQSQVGAQAAPEGYEALVTRAVAEFEARNFAEARALFLQAHALQPTARTLRGIGVTEFELRNYVDSVMRLEEALASKVRPLEGELRGQTEAALERARAFVGRIDVKVRPKAASVRVLVDGVPVDNAPEESVTLAVGEHVLQVQAPGYEEEKRTLSIKSGAPQRLLVELRALSAAPAHPGPALATQAVRDQREDDGSLWSSPWLWVGVAAVLAGGAVTGVLLAQDGGDTDSPQPLPGDIGGVVQTLRAR